MKPDSSIAPPRTSPRPSWFGPYQYWIAAVALLLVTTGLLKIHAGLSGGVPFITHERVFGVPMTPWSITAGSIELATAGLLAVAPQPMAALRLIRLLFAAILGYRLLLLGQGGGYCGCAGRLLASTPWQGREGLILGSVAAAVFLANEFLLRRCRRRPNPFVPSAPGSSVIPGSSSHHLA